MASQPVTDQTHSSLSHDKNLSGWHFKRQRLDILRYEPLHRWFHHQHDVFSAYLVFPPIGWQEKSCENVPNLDKLVRPRHPMGETITVGCLRKYGSFLGIFGLQSFLPHTLLILKVFVDQHIHCLAKESTTKSTAAFRFQIFLILGKQKSRREVWRTRFQYNCLLSPSNRRSVVVHPPNNGTFSQRGNANRVREMLHSNKNCSHAFDVVVGNVMGPSSTGVNWGKWKVVSVVFVNNQPNSSKSVSQSMEPTSRVVSVVLYAM